MFNPAQFKQKKKRKVNPDIPRPNLFSHEKRLKEQTEAVGRLLAVIDQQQEEIRDLKTKYERMQDSIQQLIGLVRRR